MFLERSVVEVVPSEFRLFDHMFAELSLFSKDQDVPSRDSQWQVRLLLGPVVRNKIVPALCVATDEFRLGDVPLFQEAIGYWKRVRERGGKMSFGHALLLCLHHVATSVLSVQFYIDDGKMKGFSVNMGGFVVKGKLPEGFDMSQYFGEKSRLED